MNSGIRHKKAREKVNQLVIDRAKDLEKSLNTIVLPLLFNNSKDENVNDWVVGYVKKPNRITVRQVIDKMEKFGKLEAGDLILQTSLIKEESDYRITDMNSAFDGINNGACLQVLELIEINLSVVKKIRAIYNK